MTEAMTERLVVDDLTFEVRRSPRRKTLGITVDRGGELIVTAPPGVADEVMATFVRDKKFWLYTKIAEKEARQQPVVGKEFVTGEGFPYLGRSYRLLLVDQQDVPLKLERGRFRLRRADAAEGRRHFIEWYTGHARQWLTERVARFTSRVQADPARVDVRDLGFRWGSCGKSGIVNFHWATILPPPSVVEYVVVHELVHLQERHHTPNFWLRVERALPDYERRKEWIAQHGMEFASF